MTREEAENLVSDFSLLSSYVEANKWLTIRNKLVSLLSENIIWQPIETAPKNKPVVVYYDHSKDAYIENGKLTNYAAHAEFSHLTGNGIIVAYFCDGYYSREDEYNEIFIPSGWFVFDGVDATDVACNAIKWLNIEAPKE